MDPIFSFRRYFGYEDNQEFVPYVDAEINMRQKPYEETYGPKNNIKIRDKEIETLIAKTLINNAINLAEESNEKRDIPEMYRYRSNEYPAYLRPPGAPPKRNQLKSNKSRSGSRRSKERDDAITKYGRDAPPGSEISMVEGVPMITLPLALLRQYMISEVDARVRHANDYYEKQHGVLNRDRMNFLAEIISLKDQKRILNAKVTSLIVEREQALAMYETATNKTAAAKAAKRKRRRDRKTQNDDTASPGQQRSDRGEQDIIENEAVGHDDSENEAVRQGVSENEAARQGVNENEAARGISENEAATQCSNENEAARQGVSENEAAKGISENEAATQCSNENEAARQGVSENEAVRQGVSENEASTQGSNENEAARQGVSENEAVRQGVSENAASIQGSGQ